MAAAIGLLAGCRSTKDRDLRLGIERGGTVALPLWFTQPGGAEQEDVPVSLGLELPRHLLRFERKYGLPGWVVYGVVRSLGSEEFVANGAYRAFSVTDERGESRVVVDDVNYDVPAARIEGALAKIAADCTAAENELVRKNVLGSFVVRRYGSFVLFSLKGGKTPSAGDPPGKDDNLLLSSGESRDPVETFSQGKAKELPVVGWRETATHYVTTMAGDFRYGDPIESFRRTEEDAIHDLARGLIVKFSHMQKNLTDSRVEKTGDYQEETLREDLTLRMRGVRVVRRMVDLPSASCLVVVQVPRTGVALK